MARLLGVHGSRPRVRFRHVSSWTRSHLAVPLCATSQRLPAFESASERRALGLPVPAFVLVLFEPFAVERSAGFRCTGQLHLSAVCVSVPQHVDRDPRPVAGQCHPVVSASSPLCPSSSSTGWLLLPRGPRCPPAPGRSAVLDIGASPCRRLVPAPCVAGPLVGPVRLVRLVRDSSVTDRGLGLGDLLRSCSRLSSSDRNPAPFR